MRLLPDIVGEQRGSMAITAVGTVFFVFLLSVVLAMDIGNRYVHKRELQTQADAGALAAASAFKYPCDVNAIKAAAESYAGKDHNVFDNIPALGSSTTFLLNQPNFADQDKPGDVELTGNPCDDGVVDVKMTERDVPWIFNFPQFLPKSHVNAQARVSLYRLDALGGTLPVAVPAPDAKRIRLTFISEVTGETLGYKDLCRRVDGESGLQIWDNAATNPAGWKASSGTCDGSTAATALPLTFDNSKYGRVVVRVQVSGSMATIDCSQQLVTCYDAGFVHGWSDQPAVTNADNSAPQPRSVVLLPGTCGDAYFSAKAAACTVGLSAKVDFQPREYDASGNPKNVTVKAVVTGSSTPYDLSWNVAARAWQTSSISVPAGAGPLDVKLMWEQTDNTITGKGTCTTKNNNPCKDTFSDVVQRTFSASESASGPIKLLQIGDLASTSGVNDVQRCSSAHPSCTTNFVVRVGVSGTLALSKPTDDPMVLRVGASGGSQNQTIDCDPILSNLEDEIALGCSPEYRRNTGQACTGSEPGGTPPLYCVAVEPGKKTNSVSAGMNRRILGSAKPSSCTNANHWPNFVSGDPRIVPVMVVPYGSFKDSGAGTGTEVPVQDFAYFYVTGWTGQGNGFDNPCQGNGDDPVPGNDSAYIVGHFITHVETLNGKGGDSPCDLSGASISGCAAVMTR